MAVFRRPEDEQPSETLSDSFRMKNSRALEYKDFSWICWNKQTKPWEVYSPMWSVSTLPTKVSP